MPTYLVRHARTAASAAYRVTSRPDAVADLDSEGRRQCRRARATLPAAVLRSCVVSALPRTAQTAALLLDGQPVPVTADPRLNEIDYGGFDGGPFTAYGTWLRGHGPWARPPGAGESQREAILRMLAGLRDLPTMPGPRLVVAHGLLLSVLTATRTGDRLTGAFFPEAGYVTALVLPDAALATLTDRVTSEIMQERRRPIILDTAATSRRVLATFGHTDHGGIAGPNEEEDRHA